MMPATIIRQLTIDRRMPRHQSADSRTLNPVLFGAVVVWIALCNSSVNATEGRSDLRSLSRLFGESTALDVLEVDRLARQLLPEERYRDLLRQVLPDHSNTIRLAVDYLPTNPSPPVAEKYGTRESPLMVASIASRGRRGGVLISPAIELAATARQMGRLEELRHLVHQRSSREPEQAKARLALEILIAWNSHDADRAGEALNELNTLVRNSPIVDFDRAPESVVIWSGLGAPRTRTQVVDLLYLLYEQIHTPGIHHRERFKRHLSSFKFQVDRILDGETVAGPNPGHEWRLREWSPVSCRTAESQGEGFPHASWAIGPGSARKITCHGEDYLYFASPLSGEFEIEADLSTYELREIRLAAGGHWAGSRYTLNECEHGLFRYQLPFLLLEEPLTNVGSSLRARIVVRDGVRRTFINGRNIYERPHGPEADPWIAIFCPWNTSGMATNPRITGNPDIPDEIDLIADSELPGWVSYFHESVGGEEADWRVISFDEGPRELIGRSRPELRGAYQESLLRYHRPMIEDGVIEYEFFAREGESTVCPALDRCCFLFDRERAGIHWLTDGPFDRTGLDPANFTPLTALADASNPLPLRNHEWNRVALTLRGDTVEIALNGVTILRRALEPENLRTFGLFHYADQSAVRVRNLRWRGEWPKELPSPRQQELADYSVEDEIARGPELLVRFEHDFSEGLPANKIFGGGREGWHFHYEELPAGVRITKRGGWYTHHTLSLPIEVEGDFDITLEYEDFQSTVVPTGEGDIQLELIFADEAATDARFYRKHHHRKNGKHEQIIEVGLFQQLEKSTHRAWPAQLSEESDAGTIRIVRRGEQLYFLHTTADSPHFRLLHRQQVTTAPIRFGGVKAIAETHRDSETKVIWKRVTVRSEHPSNFAERIAMTVDQLDRQRANLPVGRQYEFNDRTSTNHFRSWGNANHILKQEDGWRVQQPGTDEWVWCGFHCMWSLKGDYDLSLELEVVKLEETEGDHETYFLLKNRVSSTFFRDAEFKISSTGRGKRELILQQNTAHPNGETRYEKIKIQPITSVTRLRIARRGDVLFFLYRPADDAPDELLGYLPASTDDIPLSGLMTMCRTGGAGKETIINVKSMDVRATRIFEIVAEP